MTEWYYTTNDEKHGPATPAEVSAYILKGCLPTDKFLAPGMSEWVFASDAEAILRGETLSRPSRIDIRAREELDRVSSAALPNVIATLSILSLLGGILLIIVSVVAGYPALIGIGVYPIIACPFLYGFSDIVRSLRRIAFNTNLSN